MTSTLLLLLLATTTLALGMHKHFRDVCNQAPSNRQSLVLKAVGWMLLIASPAPLAPLSWPLALLYWLGLLAVAILGTAALFCNLTKRRANKPRAASPTRQPHGALTPQQGSIT